MKRVLQLSVLALPALAIFFSFRGNTVVRDPTRVSGVAVESRSVSSTNDVKADGTPVSHKVKVGETSEKVYILGRRCIIFPDDTGVKFELTNVDGKIVPWTGGALADWKELQIEYIRFTPTTRDITYIVQDWHK
jgi:hypothetical protein